MPVKIKIQVAIARDRPDNILESIRFDTTTPEETFGKIKVGLVGLFRGGVL